MYIYSNSSNVPIDFWLKPSKGFGSTILIWFNAAVFIMYLSVNYWCSDYSSVTTT